MRLRVAVACALLTAACGPPRADGRDDASAATVNPPPAAAPAKTPVSARPRVVVLVDSLTAGLGLPVSAAYPTLFEQRLKEEGNDFDVVNAGVSGDTSAGGLELLDWALQCDVRVLIVALGANDGLRGLPADQLERNLAQVIERAQARGIAVMLAGMEAPPNYGRDYIVAF